MTPSESSPDIGHNSNAAPETGAAETAPANPNTNVGGVAGDRLKSFIERIERLEEEKKALADDIREVFSEAKGSGFDVKVMRKIIRLRKMDATARREQDEIQATYMRALGMDDLPLLSGD